MTWSCVKAVLIIEIDIQQARGALKCFGKVDFFLVN